MVQRLTRISYYRHRSLQLSSPATGNNIEMTTLIYNHRAIIPPRYLYMALHANCSGSRNAVV
eukprot:7275384-Pyramimonas_sp.AAC.1